MRKANSRLQAVLLAGEAHRKTATATGTTPDAPDPGQDPRGAFIHRVRTSPRTRTTFKVALVESPTNTYGSADIGELQYDVYHDRDLWHWWSSNNANIILQDLTNVIERYNAWVEPKVNLVGYVTDVEGAQSGVLSNPVAMRSRNYDFPYDDDEGLSEYDFRWSPDRATVTEFLNAMWRSFALQQRYPDAPTLTILVGNNMQGRRVFVPATQGYIFQADAPSAQFQHLSINDPPPRAPPARGGANQASGYTGHGPDGRGNPAHWLPTHFASWTNGEQAQYLRDHPEYEGVTLRNGGGASDPDDLYD